MTSQPTDESHQGAPRGGRALLQGLLHCGHCGRRMCVNYAGANGRRTLQYRCARYRLLEPECQLAGGKRIEATVIEAFLLVAQATGSETTALAGERLRAEVETLRDKAARASRGRRPLTVTELARHQDLGRNIEAVWHASTTTLRDQKRLLRTLIDEVQVRSEEQRHLVGRMRILCAIHPPDAIRKSRRRTIERRKISCAAWILCEPPRDAVTYWIWQKYLTQKAGAK
jgi:hypothetical protein